MFENSALLTLECGVFKRCDTNQSLASRHIFNHEREFLLKACLPQIVKIVNAISKVKGMMQDACSNSNNLKITVVSLFVNVEENHLHICAIYFMIYVKI